MCSSVAHPLQQETKTKKNEPFYQWSAEIIEECKVNFEHLMHTPFSIRDCNCLIASWFPTPIFIVLLSDNSTLKNWKFSWENSANWVLKNRSFKVPTTIFESDYWPIAAGRQKRRVVRQKVRVPTLVKMLAFFFFCSPPLALCESMEVMVFLDFVGCSFLCRTWRNHMRSALQRKKLEKLLNKKSQIVTINKRR